MKKLIAIVAIVLVALVYAESHNLFAPQDASAFEPTFVYPLSTTAEAAEESANAGLEEIKYLDVETGTYKQAFTASNGLAVPFTVHIPEGATADMPVIFWLHGQGQVGRILPEDCGVIHQALSLNEDRFIIIQPTAYCGWHVERQFNAIMELVDYVVSEYQIDDDRVILTGHSLGSMGVWHFAEQAPNRWAAVIPVSSRCLTAMDKMLESDTPIWAICSNWDVSDNIRGMKNNAEKLLEANPDREVRYTVFENYSHNDMAEIPYTAEFFDWAAEKHR